MDDQQKRNDFSDFFKEDRSDEPQKRSEEGQRQEETPHYFSYGPYRSQESLHGNNEIHDNYTSYTSQGGESGSAEITRPQPVSMMETPPKPKSEWSYPVKKKSAFRSTFAAFMAGALIVSALMFAADKTNMFTGASASGTAPISESTKQSKGSILDDSGVRNAAMQEIVRPGNISEIVKMASPAVVKIKTYVKASKQSGSLFDDPFFRHFFGDSYQPREQKKEGDKVQAGMGSGFIFDKAGYILTNQHVIDGADEIYVQVEGYPEPFQAELLGSNFDLDLAALKIKGDKEFSSLKLGSSDALEVGDWVVAIGNPYGFDHTVTVGVLSAKERPINITEPGSAPRQYEHLLQTDASINPGNSGGPLLNLNGEVIGINTAVSAQAQGIGFAIPTSTVANVLDNLKNDIPVPKPFVGIYMRDLTEAGLESLELDNGVVVTAIIEDSPAAAAGLQPYDVIVEVDGTKVESANQVVEMISKKQVGDKLSLRVYREGHMMSTGITVGDANKR